MTNDALTIEDKELQALVLRLAEAALRRNQQGTIAAAAVLYDYHQQQIALAEARGAARQAERDATLIEDWESNLTGAQFDRKYGRFDTPAAAIRGAALRRGAGGEGENNG